MLSLMPTYFLTDYDKKRKRKGKSIYIAPFILRIFLRRSDMDHTVLFANHTMPAFPS